MRKKFIIFIVEGKNDESEINAILSTPRYHTYQEKYEIRFLRLCKDITTDSKSEEKNILKRIGDELKEFMKHGEAFQIKTNDVAELVHVVDLDGTFIPEKNIIYGESSAFVYDDEYIRTSNLDGAVGRNRKKSAIIRRLINTSQINNIPYRVYFVSCNMDHLLFNERMPSREQKSDSARKFMVLCDRQPDMILKSILTPEIAPFSQMEDYDESWKYIQQGCQSLQRHTNLNIYIENLRHNCFFAESI